MRGMGEPQKQIGEDGLGVSTTPPALPMVTGPMEIGNRHSQQTSEIGLTNRPVQVCAEAGAAHSPNISATAPTVRRRRIMFRRLPRTPSQSLPRPSSRGPPPSAG